MIDPKKQYRIRDGREVRIYAVDGGSEFCVHGAIRDSRGAWEARQWPADGRLAGLMAAACDLVEVKPRIQRKVWVNVYERGTGDVHTSRDSADEFSIGRIACVEIDIDVEEGHGL